MATIEKVAVNALSRARPAPSTRSTGSGSSLEEAPQPFIRTRHAYCSSTYSRVSTVRPAAHRATPMMTDGTPLTVIVRPRTVRAPA